MIYARAYDQTVADDYFAAMKRVEQRLDIVPASLGEIMPVEPQETTPEPMPETERGQVFVLVEQLSQPGLCFPARLEIVAQLRQALVGWQIFRRQNAF